MKKDGSQGHGEQLIGALTGALPQATLPIDPQSPELNGDSSAISVDQLCVCSSMSKTLQLLFMLLPRYS